MVRRKKKTTFDNFVNGLKKIVGKARKGLMTGFITAAAFLVVDGFLGLLPEGFSNITKIVIGLSIVVGVSLLGLDKKFGKK